MEIPAWLHSIVHEALSADAQAAQERARPFILMLDRIAIFPEGNQWCVLFGHDLAVGVAGFGDTPDAAARDFDRQWLTQHTRKS